MCRYLQFGHNGEDLHSMTRRWQFTQTNATMLPLELHCFVSGAAQLAFPSEPGNAETLRSNSMLRSLGISQVFFMVFLFSPSTAPNPVADDHWAGDQYCYFVSLDHSMSGVAFSNPIPEATSIEVGQVKALCAPWPV